MYTPRKSPTKKRLFKPSKTLRATSSPAKKTLKLDHSFADFENEEWEFVPIKADVVDAGTSTREDAIMHDANTQTLSEKSTWVAKVQS